MAITIHRTDVQRLLAGDALLVDVLPDAEYKSEHLAGAVSIPLKELAAARVANLDRHREIIVYCWDYQ